MFRKFSDFPKICLIKCFKGHKSLGSLCNVVKTLIVSGNRQRDGRTMSPIKLLWTAKNGFNVMFTFQCSHFNAMCSYVWLSFLPANFKATDPPLTGQL